MSLESKEEYLFLQAYLSEHGDGQSELKCSCILIEKMFDTGVRTRLLCNDDAPNEDYFSEMSLRRTIQISRNLTGSDLFYLEKYAEPHPFVNYCACDSPIAELLVLL